jgi:hypothetical protein
MRIRARMSISADGYVTTPSGWPALTADPSFLPGESHGIREFLASCEAALMGRTTFEPALGISRWPWPNLDVFVLASQRPPGTPNHVVVENDPEVLLEKLHACNPRRRHPPRRRSAYDRGVSRDRRAVQAGVGRAPVSARQRMRLTPALSVDAALSFESERALPGGSVKIVYAVNGQTD